MYPWENVDYHSLLSCAIICLFYFVDFSIAVPFLSTISIMYALLFHILSYDVEYIKMVGMLGILTDWAY